ncbi:hypothetical protein HY025_02070 [Candidatus Daviesbacteria bacterium]|nr:hypothetical protein [Candidatus Daviesbacteria bacterium]
MGERGNFFQRYMEQLPGPTTISAQNRHFRSLDRCLGYIAGTFKPSEQIQSVFAEEELQRLASFGVYNLRNRAITDRELSIAEGTKNLIEARRTTPNLHQTAKPLSEQSRTRPIRMSHTETQPTDPDVKFSSPEDPVLYLQRLASIARVYPILQNGGVEVEGLDGDRLVTGLVGVMHDTYKLLARNGYGEEADKVLVLLGVRLKIS